MKSTASISVPAQAQAPDSPQAPLEAGSRSGFLARSVAVTGYLLAALTGFVPPLAIYLITRKDSTFLRPHLAQAASAAITTALFALCSAITGGLLALDSVYLGLRVAITGAMFIWLITFGYLIAAAISACQGRFYPIPACLSAALIRPASRSGP